MKSLQSKRVVKLLLVCLIASFIPLAHVSAAEKTLTSLPTMPVAKKHRPDISQLNTLFQYDQKRPLDLEEKVLSDETGMTVHDVSFAGGHNREVNAYLVLPVAKQPVPAVIFVHWGMGGRSQFLAEAKLLAQTGLAALLVSLPFADSRKHFITSIIHLRRAVDLLTSDPRIDAKRIGYVGHSWGGTLGGILAGIEDRIRAYVLMAGFPSYANYAKRSDLDEFTGMYYVAHARPAKLMFQFAVEDTFVSNEAARIYFESASDPKTIHWYKHTTHKFDNEQAQLDRLNWLGTQLNYND